MGMYRKALVPKDFVVPQELKTDKFILRLITVDDLDLDFEAVKNSVDIHGQPDSNSVTKQQDLVDLGYHQKEWQKRSSFTYIVTNLSGDKSLGCVYIYPCNDKTYDAEAVQWVTKDAFELGLEPVLFDTVKNWLKTSWPFKKVYFVERS